MTSDVFQFLGNPSVSYWLRNALISALARDPVDAANDAETLAELLRKHADDTNAAMENAIKQ